MKQTIGKNVITVENNLIKKHIAMKMVNVNVVKLKNQEKKNVYIQIENGELMKQSTGKYAKIVAI